MPFQPLNFLNMPIRRTELPDIFGSLREGLMLKNLPEQLRQQKESQNLATMLQKQKVESFPEQQDLAKRLGEARIGKMEREAQQPLKEYNLQGPARLAYDLQILKDRYGPEHPIVRNAEKAFEASLIKGIGGVGAKDQQLFKREIEDANQYLSPEQRQEAINRVSQGYGTLSDGTPINVPESAVSALNRIKKGEATAALQTQEVQTEQAKAAIPVMQNYALKGLKPFGDTWGNVSIPAVMASLSSSKEDQKKLGRLIAANQLQFDLAQEYIRLSRAKPGVTITNELMNIGKQRISDRWPKISYTAREEASKYLLEALDKANDAMREVPLGLGSLKIKDVQKKESQKEEKEKPRRTYVVGKGWLE